MLESAINCSESLPHSSRKSISCASLNNKHITFTCQQTVAHTKSQVSSGWQFLLITHGNNCLSKFYSFINLQKEKVGVLSEEFITVHCVKQGFDLSSFTLWCTKAMHHILILLPFFPNNLATDIYSAPLFCLTNLLNCLLEVFNASNQKLKAYFVTVI